MTEQPLQEGPMQRTMAGVLMLVSALLGGKQAVTSLNQLQPAQLDTVQTQLTKVPDNLVKQKTGLSKQQVGQLLQQAEKGQKAGPARQIPGASLQVSKQIQAVSAFTGQQAVRYMVLDDVKDRLHVVEGDSIVNTFDIITGKNQGDELSKLNFGDWLVQEKGMGGLLKAMMKGSQPAAKKIAALEDEYFDTYVGKTNKITPSGYYVVSYDFLKSLALTGFSPKDYGANYLRIQKMDGTELLNAIHGTQNPVRLKALANNADGARNLSYGCANMKAEDLDQVVSLASNGDLPIFILSDDGRSIIDPAAVTGLTPDAMGDPGSTDTWALLLGKAIASVIGFRVLWKRRKLLVMPGLGEATALDPLSSVPDEEPAPGGSPEGSATTGGLASQLPALRQQATSTVDALLMTLANKDPELQAQTLRRLRSLTARLKNFYVNSLKKIDPQMATALRGQSYKKGQLAAKVPRLREGWFDSWIGKKLAPRKAALDDKELELTGELGSMVHRALAHLKAGGRLGPKSRQAIEAKVHQITGQFIDTLEAFLTAKPVETPVDALQEIIRIQLKKRH